MKYTQFMQEMQKKREARSLSGQEIIALALVIAAFAYIIFGLINTEDADYDETGYSQPLSESYDTSNNTEPTGHYNTYYEKTNTNS